MEACHRGGSAIPTVTSWFFSPSAGRSAGARQRTPRKLFVGSLVQNDLRSLGRGHRHSGTPWANSYSANAAKTKNFRRSKRGIGRQSKGRLNGPAPSRSQVCGTGPVAHFSGALEGGRGTGAASRSSSMNDGPKDRPRREDRSQPRASHPAAARCQECSGPWRSARSCHGWSRSWWCPYRYLRRR
jgi:hypothetical protein